MRKMLYKSENLDKQNKIFPLKVGNRGWRQIALSLSQARPGSFVPTRVLAARSEPVVPQEADTHGRANHRSPTASSSRPRQERTHRRRRHQHHARCARARPDEQDRSPMETQVQQALQCCAAFPALRFSKVAIDVIMRERKEVVGDRGTLDDTPPDAIRGRRKDGSRQTPVACGWPLPCTFFL